MIPRVILAVVADNAEIVYGFAGFICGETGTTGMAGGCATGETLGAGFGDSGAGGEVVVVRTGTVSVNGGTAAIVLGLAITEIGSPVSHA